MISIEAYQQEVGPSETTSERGLFKKESRDDKICLHRRNTPAPFGVVRAALSAVGVDTKKMYDASFIGGHAVKLLTDVEYCETIERVLTARKSTMKILKYFGPLSPELPKKTPRADANRKRQ